MSEFIHKRTKEATSKGIFKKNKSQNGGKQVVNDIIILMFYINEHSKFEYQGHKDTTID